MRLIEKVKINYEYSKTLLLKKVGCLKSSDREVVKVKVEYFDFLT